MTRRRTLIAVTFAVALVTAGCGGGGGSSDDRSVLAYCVDEFEAMADEHPDYYEGIDPSAACEETIAESGDTRAAVDTVLTMTDSFRTADD